MVALLCLIVLLLSLTFEMFSRFLYLLLTLVRSIERKDGLDRLLIHSPSPARSHRQKKGTHRSNSSFCPRWRCSCWYHRCVIRTGQCPKIHWYRSINIRGWKMKDVDSFLKKDGLDWIVCCLILNRPGKLFIFLLRQRPCKLHIQISMKVILYMIRLAELSLGLWKRCERSWATLPWDLPLPCMSWEAEVQSTNYKATPPDDCCLLSKMLCWSPGTALREKA